MAKLRYRGTGSARRVAARVSRRGVLRGPSRASSPAKVFPDVRTGAIVLTRQEVFFFGTQSGDGRFSEVMPFFRIGPVARSGAMELFA